MNSKELIESLKKIIINNPPDKKIIREVFLFGSWSTNIQIKSSDVDVLVLHSARNVRDYEYIIDYSSYLSVEISKNKLICDIFLSNVKNIDYMLKYSGIYLCDLHANKILVYSSSHTDSLQIKKNLQNKIDIDVIKSNALLEFIEDFNSYPSVILEKRRKNLKNAYWLTKHFSKIISSHGNLDKIINKRMSTIELEDPLETINLDLKIFNKLLLMASKSNIFETNIKTLVNVQICKLYFIDSKRIRLKPLKNDDNFINFIHNGISIIFRCIFFNKIEISSKCQTNLQYLVTTYLNKTKISIKNTKRDYCILLNILDDIITNV